MHAGEQVEEICVYRKRSQKHDLETNFSSYLSGEEFDLHSTPLFKCQPFKIVFNYTGFFYKLSTVKNTPYNNDTIWILKTIMHTSVRFTV